MRRRGPVGAFAPPLLVTGLCCAAFLWALRDLAAEWRFPSSLRPTDGTDGIGQAASGKQQGAGRAVHVRPMLWADGELPFGGDGVGGIGQETQGGSAGRRSVKEGASRGPSPSPPGLHGQGEKGREKSESSWETEEDGKLREEVRKVCEKVATRDRVVIMTTTTKSAVHMLDNLMTTLARLFLDKHCIIFTFDQPGFEFVNTKWPGQGVMGYTSKLGKEFRSALESTDVILSRDPVYTMLMRTRPPLMHLILQLNYSLLFTDTDVVYVQNPLSLVANPHYSIYFSMDKFPGTEDMEEVIPFVTNVTKHPPQLCAGMSFFRTGEASRKLLGMWADAVVENKKPKYKDDQAYLWEIVNKLMEGATHDEDPGDGATLPYCIAALPLRCVSNGLHLWRIVEWRNGKGRNMMKEQLGCLVAMHYDWFFRQTEKQMAMFWTHTWVASIGAPPHTLVTAEVALNGDGTLRSINASVLLQSVVPRARNGTLLVTIAHVDDKHDFVKDFIPHLEKAKVTDTSVIFVLDDFTFQQVNERHPGMAVLLHAPALSSTPSPPSPLRTRLDLLPFLLQTLLTLNLSVCYCDMETIWHKWPFPLRSSHFDILVRYPGNLPVPESVKEDETVVALEELQVREATQSWLYLQPTPASSNFTRMWLHLLAQSEHSETGETESQISTQRLFRLALVHTKGPQISALSPLLMPPTKLDSWKEKSLALLRGSLCVVDGSLAKQPELLKGPLAWLKGL